MKNKVNIMIRDECGEFAGTRYLGKKIRSQVEAEIEAGNEVIIDFSNVDGTSHGFLDELVGKLYKENGFEGYSVENYNNFIEPILRFVIYTRMKERYNEIHGL